MGATSRFFDIRAATDERVLLYIYGDIVGDEYWKYSPDDCCPSDIVNALKAHPRAAVDVHINSGGGDAFAGIAICNILRAHSGKKTVYIDGLAASSASIIAMAGDEIIMPRSALIMVHKCWSVAWGCNADEMRKVADTLDTIDRSALMLYMDKALPEVTEADMASAVAAETWYPGEQAAKVWEIALSDVTAAACASDLYTRYAHVPETLAANKPASPADPPAEDEIEVDLDLMRSFIFAENRKEHKTHE